jgi:AcrR family transcriptional regulator
MSEVKPPSNAAVLVPRRRGTRATRRKIADAAVEVFSSRGYTATSLQAIADAAGVHVQSIYQVYGSKTAVLAAACEVARAGGEDPETPPEQWPWAQELMAEPDPARQLQLFAGHIRATAPQAGPLINEIRSAARSDAELARFLADTEAGRFLGPSGVVALLVAKKALRRGLDPEQAAATMFAVASYESYELLVTDRGWTPDDYEHWLGETLVRLLLK